MNERRTVELNIPRTPEERAAKGWPKKIGVGEDQLRARIAELKAQLAEAHNDLDAVYGILGNATEPAAHQVDVLMTELEAARAQNLRSATLQHHIEKLLGSANLLYQNAEGCAVKHHGADFELQGLPGWLAHERSIIEAAALAAAGLPPTEPAKED